MLQNAGLKVINSKGGMQRSHNNNIISPYVDIRQQQNENVGKHYQTPEMTDSRRAEEAVIGKTQSQANFFSERNNQTLREQSVTD